MLFLYSSKTSLQFVKDDSFTHGTCCQGTLSIEQGIQEVPASSITYCTFFEGFQVRTGVWTRLPTPRGHLRCQVEVVRREVGPHSNGMARGGKYGKQGGSSWLTADRALQHVG